MNVDFIFNLISRMALLGPVGYAVLCICARDEAILENPRDHKVSEQRIRVYKTTSRSHEQLSEVSARRQ